jgi:Putative DNA-binding domain
VTQQGPKLLQGDDIAALVSDQVEESLTLEFKRELNLKSEPDKREAAKDASGMANARGGRIIYGIDEAEVGNTGRKAAKALCPLTEVNLAERLDNVLSDAISPRVPNLRIYRVEIPNGFFLVADVAASDYDLHMVSAYGEGRYYRRTEKAVRPMTEPEITRAYEQIARLKSEAAPHVKEIVGEELPPSSRASTLIIPIGCGQNSVDVPRLVARLRQAGGPAIGCSGDMLDLLSGYLYPYGGGLQAVLRDTTFWDSPISSLRIRLDGVIHFSEPQQQQSFHLAHPLRQVHDACRLARFVWGEMNVRGPFKILVRIPLASPETKAVDLGNARWRELQLRDEKQLIFIESDSTRNDSDFVTSVLRKAMDRLWHYLGKERCPWFDANGMLNQSLVADVLR